jgi:hypothetical protein
VKTDSKMATIGIMVSGRAVPTAASTLPTPPCCRPSRAPRISTALVNREAATRIAARASPNSTSVSNDPTSLSSSLPLGPQRRCANATPGSRAGTGAVSVAASCRITFYAVEASKQARLGRRLNDSFCAKSYSPHRTGPIRSSYRCCTARLPDCHCRVEKFAYPKIVSLALAPALRPV